MAATDSRSWQYGDNLRTMVRKYNQIESDVSELMLWKESAASSIDEATKYVKGLTKADIGLGNVDNTSDTDKPVSKAVRAAIDAVLNDQIDTSDAVAEFLDTHASELPDDFTANSILACVEKEHVYFGLSEDGYFNAYVPESYREVGFDTQSDYNSPNYGRLMLRILANTTGDNVIIQNLLRSVQFTIGDDGSLKVNVPNELADYISFSDGTGDNSGRLVMTINAEHFDGVSG